MPRPTSRRTRLTVEILEVRETPTAQPWSIQSFDESRSSMPLDWSHWPAASTVRVVPDAGINGTNTLVASSGPTPTRAWEDSILPGDYGAEASIRTDGSVPAQILIRGHNLNSPKPTYYAASIQTGGIIQIIRKINGTSTVLASIKAQSWPTGRWIELAIQPNENHLAVTVRRIDNGLWLDSAGHWQSQSTAAITASDGLIPNGGQAGFNHPAGGRGRVRLDNFTVLTPDTLAATGWNDWGLAGNSGFRIGADSAVVSTGNSAHTGRLWLKSPSPSDVSVSANILVDSLIPAQVIARGQNLDGTQPTYYGASVTRGTEIKLLRVIKGVTTELGTLKSATYLSGVRLNITLTTQGGRQQVRVQRTDSKAWLNAFGEWQFEPATALASKDSIIAGAGFVGFARPAQYAGSLTFDNFNVTHAAGDVTPPRIAIRIQALAKALRSGTIAGQVRFMSTVIDPGGMGRLEFLVDDTVIDQSMNSPHTHDFDTGDLTNGKHSLTVRAWDAAGNLSVASRSFVVLNRSDVAKPTIPAHYDHIRVAALAYNGNPMGPAELKQLQENVDLVIPNARYLRTIDAATPATPQLIYSNISNLYLDLLSDWLNYADQNGFTRESAFYHVAHPTAFAGDSPSSQPVTWFWNVARNKSDGTITSVTSQARGTQAGGVALGATGEAITIGYPDRFRELNLTMSRTGSANWTGLLEYPSKVDANGTPTAWNALKPGADSTNSLRTSGRVTFEPPADWKPAVLTGSTARQFYVRIRTTIGTVTDAPITSTILGRDYVAANGAAAGMIPAFDTAADANRDGYLNDSEYAKRRPGFDARFLYESRLFYPTYGQMRFVTNPSGTGISAWAADFHRRFLAKHPLADGIFMDNSGGRLPIDGAKVVESTAAYASDYAAVLGAVNRAIAPKWVLANTSGGGSDADRVVRRVPGTIEEFALRPLAHTWSQFLDLASTVNRRLSQTGSGYLVLDSLSNGGSPTDPRTRMAALADYYLLADPTKTMFMAWGGEEPASTWTRHWWDAIGFDVGQPIGAMSEFATGTDPSNIALAYHVYQRQYGNALVLYKPLSYTAGKGIGTTGDISATVHQLNGNYRLLNADGTLGPVTTQVSLRNGEGAILVRA